MARFTSNQWLIIDYFNEKVKSIATDSQTLFLNNDLRTENGKLSLKQAVYKLHRFGNGERLASLKDGVLYSFNHECDLGKGQSEYTIEEITSGLIHEEATYAFSNGSTPPPPPKKQTKTETPKTKNDMGKTPQELMAEAMAMIANGSSGSVNAEEVQKIVHNELAMLDRPKVIELEIKLPKGGKSNVKGQHKEFPKLLRLMGAKKSAMLVGDAGSGKTFGARMAAKALELDFRVFSFTNETSLGRTMGFMNAMGEYVPTAVREMYENGGVLILDEFDAANANVAMALNNLLDGDEYVFADKVVNRHEDFRYIACTNTYASGANKKYNARNKIDDSTMDRFAAIIDWGYDEVLERRLFGDTEATRVVQQIRSNANKMGLNGLITPRRTRDVNDMVSIGFSIKESVQMSILAKHKGDVQKGLTEGVSL